MTADRTDAIFVSGLVVISIVQLAYLGVKKVVKTVVNIVR